MAVLVCPVVMLVGDRLTVSVVNAGAGIGCSVDSMFSQAARPALVRRASASVRAAAKRRKDIGTVLDVACAMAHGQRQH